MENKKLTHMDADKEYILSGTINEIISALTSEFLTCQKKRHALLYMS